MMGESSTRYPRDFGAITPTVRPRRRDRFHSGKTGIIDKSCLTPKADAIGSVQERVALADRYFGGEPMNCTPFPRPLRARTAASLVALAIVTASRCLAQPLADAPLPPAAGAYYVEDADDNPPIELAYSEEQFVYPEQEPVYIEEGYDNSPQAAPVPEQQIAYLDDQGARSDWETAGGAAPAQLACYQCGEVSCGCEPCGCPPCRPRRRSFVFGEFLYLEPSGGDVTHAQQQDGLGAPGPGVVPFGRVGTVSQDHEPGVRAGFGIRLDDCSSLNASYTRFESASADLLELPTIPAGLPAIGSLVHHPGASITQSSGPVTATQDIDFQLVDLTYRDALKDYRWGSFNYSLGAQYGELEQDFNQNGVFAGSSAGTIDTFTDIEFRGTGLKAGIDCERFFGCCVGVFGKLSAAAMSGDFNTHYQLINSTGAVLLADSVWKDNRVVSHVEYEIGLVLRTKDDRLRLSAGYQFQHWGNVVTTSDLIDAVQADNYTDLGDTLNFDGLTGRIECRF